MMGFYQIRYHRVDSRSPKDEDQTFTLHGPTLSSAGKKRPFDKLPSVHYYKIAFCLLMLPIIVCCTSV